MEIINTKDKKYTIGYHTQEYRPEGELTNPIICKEINAWLGRGYYFWVEEEFAKYWGEDFKVQNTGYYDIYKAKLDITDCIDAVFDLEGYYFFRNQVDKVVKKFESEGQKINLKSVHDFLEEKVWKVKGITGIIYDDLPANPKDKPNRKYSLIKHSEKENKIFYYHKRIQIVMFLEDNIHNFALHLEEQT